MTSRRILVAVDASPSSDHVVEFVNSFFGELDVEVIAINVAPEPVAWVPQAVAPGAVFAWHTAPPLGGTALEDTAVLSDAAARTIDRSGLQDDERIVTVGEPVEMIVRAAVDEDVDVIVVGRSHKGILDRVLSGSVSRQLVREAPLPVLVVPG